MKETKLKSRRKEMGLTQMEVAKQAKVSVRNYQRMENGDRVPRADTAKLIAKALHTTVEKLF